MKQTHGKFWNGCMILFVTVKKIHSKGRIQIICSKKDGYKRQLLRELRMKTPDEIKRYQKIIANKDAILADAQAKADSMLEQAQVHTNELVSEHEIMQQAYAQANEIVMAATEQAQQILDNATSDANDIRIGAIQYTNDLLANAENIIGHTLDSYTTKYDGLVSSLQECYETVHRNREELEIPERSSNGLESEFGGVVSEDMM